MYQDITNANELAIAVYPVVRAYANRRLPRRPSDADDVTQIAIIHVMARADRLIKIANHPNHSLYLGLTSIVNESIGYHFGNRTKKGCKPKPKRIEFSRIADKCGRPFDPADTSGPDAEIREPDSPPTFVEQFLDAIPGAPKEPFDIVRRIVVECEEQGEIAREMGISPKAMGDRFRTAKRTLLRYFTRLNLYPAGEKPSSLSPADRRSNAKKKAARAAARESTRPGDEWVRLVDIRREMGGTRIAQLFDSLSPDEWKTHYLKKYVLRTAYDRFVATLPPKKSMGVFSLN